MRVYELAKEYDKKTTEFLELIQGFGIDVTSHMSSVNEYQKTLIEEKINGSSDIDEDSEGDNMEVKRNGDSLEITVSREDFESSPTNVNQNSTSPEESAKPDGSTLSERLKSLDDEDPWLKQKKEEEQKK